MLPLTDTDKDVAGSRAPLYTDAGAVIVSGGPQSVFNPDSLTVDADLWNMNVPILGICYGVQVREACWQRQDSLGCGSSQSGATAEQQHLSAITVCVSHRGGFSSCCLINERASGGGFRLGSCHIAVDVQT